MPAQSCWIKFLPGPLGNPAASKSVETVAAISLISSELGAGVTGIGDLASNANLYTRPGAACEPSRPASTVTYRLPIEHAGHRIDGGYAVTQTGLPVSACGASRRLSSIPTKSLP
jgi:hypothetical protein